MFTLDKRLAADCIEIGKLSLCQLLLMNDSQYPWCILVPCVADIHEVYQLPTDVQQRLWLESSHVASAMASCFVADKINIAALGNQVKQLHVHHVARFISDPAWPQPIWGAHPAKPYLPDELATRVDILKMHCLNMPPKA